MRRVRLTEVPPRLQLLGTPTLAVYTPLKSCRPEIKAELRLLPTAKAAAMETETETVVDSVVAWQ